jgi:hypothetical protein
MCAFAATKVGDSVHGNDRVTFGTFTNDVADTGGVIDTGLATVEYFNANASSAVEPVQVNDTFPATDGNVTIVTAADVDGFWQAYGK